MKMNHIGLLVTKTIFKTIILLLAVFLLSGDKHRSFAVILAIPYYLVNQIKLNRDFISFDKNFNRVCIVLFMFYCIFRFVQIR